MPFLNNTLVICLIGDSSTMWTQMDKVQQTEREKMDLMPLLEKISPSAAPFQEFINNWKIHEVISIIR